MKLLKNQKALILSHFYKRTTIGGGPPQDVRDYLLDKIDTIAYIEHPFPYADDNRSSLTIYKNGKEEKKIFGPSVSGPDWLFYIIDVFLTLYFYARCAHIYDFCVALDNLNTFSVILLRKIGLIKKVIFYSIDYTPYRFQDKTLNSIYHFIDKLACYNADIIWVLSFAMRTLREKRGIQLDKSAPSLLLPMGANLKRIKVLSLSQINRFQIVYVGSLIEKQGLQLVLEALPAVIDAVPRVSLMVIGKGNFENDLKKLSQSLKLEKYVKFLGFVEDHRKVEKILTKSSVSVATYTTEKENYAYYTDPGKPKLYLGCGLPVIITDVPKIAKKIGKNEAGIVVEYSKNDVSNALITLLTKDTVFAKMRENALLLSKQYDTDTLITKAFNNS